jgi:uncharacterized membrane protein YbhN (UPF0104 family)
MRSIVSFLVKAAVSALLIYAAIDWTQFASIMRRISEISLPWAAAATVLLLVQLPLQAVRWRAIGQQCGAKLSVNSALRFTFIGTFFGQILLPAVGSDAARIWLSARTGAGWRAAMYSVLTDRGVGLLVLAAMVAVSLPWSLQIILNPIGRSTLLLITCGTVVGAVVFFSLPRMLRRFAGRWRALFHLIGISSVSSKVLTSLHPGLLVIATSAAIHLLTVVAAWLLARSVMAPLGLGYATILVPPIILIAAIPISIAGWGIRESAMAVAFGYAGLAPADGLLISILFGAASLIVGIIGGAVWVSAPDRRAMTLHATDPY